MRNAPAVYMQISIGVSTRDVKKPDIIYEAKAEARRRLWRRCMD